MDVIARQIATSIHDARHAGAADDGPLGRAQLPDPDWSAV